jgi:type IV pilus assembly protein PilN
MIRLNLLPHRELRRERRKKDFITTMVASVVAGAALAGLVSLGIAGRIDTQQARNDFIKRENEKLDTQVREIAQLREEIDSLKARKLAVESLQRDRAVPVHLLDELVRRAPAGMYFRQLRQSDRKVTLAGLSQSNERVSDLLRNLGDDTRWLEKPELVEIKAVTLGKGDGRDKAGEGRRLFEFSLNARIGELAREEGVAAAVGSAARASGAQAPATAATKSSVNVASR